MITIEFGAAENQTLDRNSLFLKFSGNDFRENIDKIIALTDGDIKSIIEIYNYLNKNSTNILDYIKESLKNVKEEKYDAYLLLEFYSK